MSHLMAFEQLTKRYGSVQALDEFTAEVSPGRITAFLGPNGSGKTTSMRLLLDLAEPTAGSASIAGLPYRELRHPTRVVGRSWTRGSIPTGARGTTCASSPPRPWPRPGSTSCWTWWG